MQARRTPITAVMIYSIGNFFILKGQLIYVADISKRKNINGKTNARMRCIFENGTESNLLLRSLARELYRNGRRVTEIYENLLNAFDNIEINDIDSGFIYVLKTLSTDPLINRINNLYKIGYSKTSIEKRIQNAIDDPTYLMAPVKIISTFQCFNLNPQKLELLLHNFFGSSCLNIDIFDKNGLRHSPREWFVAP